MKRMVEISTAIGHEIRLKAVVNVLNNPDGIPAGEAYPDDLPPAGRGRHIKKLQLLFNIDRPSKKEDSIYSIPERLRAPLYEVVNALHRLTQAVDRQRVTPQVVVSADADDGYLVNGQPVESRKLASVIKQTLRRE